MKKHLLAFAGLAAFAAPAFAQEPVTGTPAYAPEEPLWELRLGGTGLWAPDYPGADEESFNWAAAPIFIYRGDRIRFGEYGMARAIATETSASNSISPSTPPTRPRTPQRAPACRISTICCRSARRR